MIPLFVLLLSVAGLRAAGALGAPFLDDWMTATRLGLAAMFLFTGLAHFGRERGDLVRMVPPALPRPGLLVTLTGVAELLLALLLVWPDTARGAGLALMALLVALFPANVHAARTGHTLRGRGHLPLGLRTLLQAAWIALLWWSAGCRACRLGDSGDPHSPIVVTSDVHRFVQLALPGGDVDTTCAALPRYFAGGSPGLAAYRRKFRVGPAELCAAVRRVPERYAELGRHAAAFDSVATEVAVAFLRLRSIYPAARFVPAYVVAGSGVSGGTTTLGRRPVILIGAELATKTAGLARTIVHELMHVEQEYPAWGAMTGGPAALRGTLLRHSIKEGAADFLVELVMGPWRGDREVWAEPREAELWEEFRHDMESKDYSRWLYNGWNRAALGDRPPDLGYYVGSRIARAYYERATDKRQAVRDILTIRDFDRFLARSGYAGRSGAATSTSRDRHVD